MFYKQTGKAEYKKICDLSISLLGKKWAMKPLFHSTHRERYTFPHKKNENLGIILSFQNAQTRYRTLQPEA